MPIDPSNFTPQASLPSDFNPASYPGIPHPSYPLFKPEQFLTSDLHAQAETMAREAIRSHLSKTNGGKIVYSQADLSSYGRGSVRGKEIFDNIATGKAIVR